MLTLSGCLNRFHLRLASCGISYRYTLETPIIFKQASSEVQFRICILLVLSCVCHEVTLSYYYFLAYFILCYHCL